MRHPRNWNKLEAMNTQAKTAYMASGNVTTDVIWQIEDVETKKLKRFFVAKIRGIIVSDGDLYKFETREEARTFGNEMRAHWRNELHSLEPIP